MDERLQQLLDRLDRRLATGERLSAAFALELAKVMKDAERALRTLVLAERAASAESLRVAVLLQRVRRILATSGYDTLVSASTAVMSDQLVASVLQGADLRKLELVQSSQATIAALREIATVNLWQSGDETATALWRSLVQHLFTTRPTSEILQDLADALDRDEAHIRTLFDTQVSIYGRQVEDLATEDLGPAQPFLYAGPIDDKTRPWCLERVGKVFLRAEIEAMDNGQLPNPMVTGGGYNCRHSFMAVESQAMRDLVGTGWRAPQYDGDVQRILQRKASRKKAA